MAEIDELYWALKARDEDIKSAIANAQKGMKETAGVAKQTGSTIGADIEKGAKKAGAAVEREIGAGVRKSLSTLGNTARRAAEDATTPLVETAGKGGERAGKEMARRMAEKIRGERAKVRAALQETMDGIDRQLRARESRAEYDYRRGDITADQRDGRVRAARTLANNAVTSEATRFLGQRGGGELRGADQEDFGLIVGRYREAGKRARAAFEEGSQQAGTRSGDELASRFTGALRRRLDADVGAINAAAARGLLTAGGAEARGRAAAERYNASLLAGMKKLELQGRLTRGGAGTLGGSLVDVNQVGSDAAQSVETFSGRATGALSRIGGAAKLWLAGVLVSALLLGQRAFTSLLGTLSSAEERSRAIQRLGAASRLLGVESARLRDLARNGREEFKLGTTDANNLAVATAKLAQRSGDVGRAQELMARALDLGAANGRTAQEVIEDLNLTLLGQDEGLNKLGLSNPQQIYEQWAKSAGTTAAKLTDTQKAQAVLTAIVAAGSRVQGEYGKQVQTDIGRWQQFKTRMGEAAGDIGERLLPVVLRAADVFEQNLKPALETIISILDRFAGKLQNDIRLLRELGVTAAEVLPSQLRDRLPALEQELARKRVGVTIARRTRRVVARDQSTGEEIVDEGYESAGTAALAAEAAAINARRARAGRDLTVAESARLAQISRIIDAEREAARATGDLAQTRQDLATATQRAQQYTKLRDLDAEVASLEARAAAEGDNLQVTRRLTEAMQARAAARKALGMNEVTGEEETPVTTQVTPDPSGGDTEGKADRTRRENAQRDLAQRTAELREVAAFRDAAGRPFRVLDEVPGKLREAINEAITLGREIASIDEKVRESGQAASPEVAAERAGLVQMREEARARARRVAADPANLQDDELRQTRERVDELTKSFRDLAGMGVSSLDDVPRPFAEIVERISATDQQLKQLRESMQAVHEANGEVPAEAKALEQLYVRQGKALAEQANAIRPLKGILEELPSVELDLFKDMDPAEITALGKSLGVVADRTRRVTEADQAAWKARQQYGAESKEARAAEEALNDTRNEARNAILAEIAVVERSTLSDREKTRAVKALRAQLEGLAGDSKQASAAVARAIDQARGIAQAIGTVSSALEQMGVKLSEGQKKAVDGYIQMVEGAAEFATAFFRGDVIGMITGGIKSIAGMVDLAKGLTGWGTTQEEKQRAELERGLWLQMIDAMRQLKNALLEDVSTTQVRDDIASSQRNARILQEAEDSGRTGGRGLEYLAKQLGLVAQNARRDESIAALRAYYEEIESRYGMQGAFTSFIDAGDREGLEQALRGLPARLEEALKRQGTYGNDPAGIIQRINDQFRILGNTNVEEKLEAINTALKAAGKNAGQFQAAFDELADLDLSTEEGRKRRDEIVREALERANAGGANFGSLTPEQFRQLLEEWARATPGDRGGVVGEGSNATRVNVAGTEVQVAAQNLLLSTITDYTSYLPRIHALLGGLPDLSAVTPLSPPALSFPSSSGPAVMTCVMEIREFPTLPISVTGDALRGAPGDVLGDAGRNFGRGFADGFAEQSAALGIRVRRIATEGGRS